MKERSKARLAVSSYVGVVIVALSALAVALHIDHKETRDFLEIVLAFVALLGIPVAMVAAAARTRFATFSALLMIAVVAGFLVAMASGESSDFRELLFEDARVRWASFAVLFGVSVLVAMVLVTVGRHYHVLAVILGLGLAGVMCGVLAGTHPAGFRASMQEDSWAEWATFYAWAAAGLCSAAVLWRSFRKKDSGQERAYGWFARLTLLGISLFCLLVAGEEVSWGQRLFAFEPPELFMERNFQQELNIHNLFTEKEIWGIPLDTRYLVAYVCIVYGVVMPLVGAIAVRLGRGAAREQILTPDLHLTPWFAAVALAEFTYPVKYTGEASELLLGVIFLADGVLRLPAVRVDVTLRRNVLVPVSAMALALIAGVVTPLLAERVFYGPASGRAAQARKEIDLLKSDLQKPGVTRSSLRRRRAVHKRVFTATHKGYLRFDHQSQFLACGGNATEGGVGEVSKGRRDYFLDPWSNPYWIYYSRREATIILYSFGPNRRRDTRFEEMSGEQWRDGLLGGDDIGLALPADTRDLVISAEDSQRVKLK